MNRLLMGLGGLLLIGGAYHYITHGLGKEKCGTAGTEKCVDGVPYKCSSGLVWEEQVGTCHDSPSGPCTEPSSVCDDGVSYVCSGGEWVQGGLACAPCPESATACVGGQSLTCHGGSWYTEGTACSNNICAQKECNARCDGANWMVPQEIPCIMLNGEAQCQMKMKNKDDPRCQYRYPVQVTMLVNGKPLVPTGYHGSSDWCHKCDCIGVGCDWYGNRGAELDVTFKVVDQWNKPLPDARLYVEWQCDSNLVGMFVKDSPRNTGAPWCGGGRIYPSLNNVVLYTNEEGLTWDKGIWLMQYSNGSASFLYNLTFNVTVHDPNGIKDPLHFTFGTTIQGLGGGPTGMVHKSCQATEYEVIQ